MRQITYAVDPDGVVISRVGREVAWPVLDFEAIGKDGDFSGPLTYNLVKMDFYEAMRHGVYRTLRWTKKIPMPLKNRHRVFWGMKKLPLWG